MPRKNSKRYDGVFSYEESEIIEQDYKNHVPYQVTLEKIKNLCGRVRTESQLKYQRKVMDLATKYNRNVLVAGTRKAMMLEKAEKCSVAELCANLSSSHNPLSIEVRKVWKS